MDHSHLFSINLMRTGVMTGVKGRGVDGIRDENVEVNQDVRTTYIPVLNE